MQDAPSTTQVVEALVDVASTQAPITKGEQQFAQFLPALDVENTATPPEPLTVSGVLDIIDTSISSVSAELDAFAAAATPLMRLNTLPAEGTRGEEDAESRSAIANNIIALVGRVRGVNSHLWQIYDDLDLPMPPSDEAPTKEGPAPYSVYDYIEELHVSVGRAHNHINLLTSRLGPVLKDIGAEPYPGSGVVGACKVSTRLLEVHESLDSLRHRIYILTSSLALG